MPFFPGNKISKTIPKVLTKKTTKVINVKIDSTVRGKT
jgi:hypothetical protein